MLVSKICLTGGPCAGKTTALSKIEKELTELGYKVFIIDEVATRLINAGIKPFGDDSISMLEFEDIVLKEQLMEEECYERVAQLLDKKCVIICDRGIFDIKSFIDQEEFDFLLRKYNLSKLKLMDSYNLVIHMNTAAKGALEFYTNENNKARSESITEAKKRDDEVQKAWCGHSNYNIVDNSTNFEDKIDKVISLIKESLGIRHYKTKKYLVDLKTNLNNEVISKVNISQTYLSTDKDCEIRLRKRTIDNESTYYVTAKRSKNEEGKYIDEKIITEEKIDKKTYERLLGQKEVLGTIEKIRSCVVENDILYKVDEFENMVIMECDSDAKIPSFVNVIKEVTEDNDYKNYNIAKKRNKTYTKTK